MKQVDHNQFWLIKDNPITKAGVFPYLGKQISPSLEPDRIYQVYRPEEEIKKAANTFKLVPLVDDHTMLGPEFTPAEQKGVHGVLGEDIKEKNGTLFADVKIFSEQLKREIQDGKKELSLGYFCKYDLTPGQYNGMHYDAVQRDLKGNHIALVDNGRMGHDVRVMDAMAFDALDIVGSIDENPNHSPKNGQFVSGGSVSKDARKQKPKLAKKTDTVSPVKVDDTVPHFDSFSQLKHYIFNELNVLGDVEIKGAGTVIHFGKDQVKRALKRGRSDTQNQFFADVKSSVANAKYGGFQESDERHPNVAGQDIYYTAIKIGKDVYAIKLSADVQHNHSDNKYSYAGHHLENIKKYQGSDTGVPPVNASPDTISIAQFEQIFKPQNGSKVENMQAKDLSSTTHGVGGKDAAPGKENKRMDKVKQAIEAIKALFADPEAGDKEGKLAEILGTLAPAASAGDNCSKDEDVDKRALIDEIGGILKGKLSDELIRTIMGKAEKLAYNDSSAGSADDDGVEPLKAQQVKEADEELTDKVNGVEKAVDELPAKVLQMIAQRDALYHQVSALVGTFDHATMTEEQVAQYACDKLDDLKGTPANKAVDVLKGYLKAQKPVQILSMDAAVADDEKDAGFEAFMKGDK